ncbi:MAG TPA: DUF4262 domain-containing protein [Allosphingosinicella sp.]|nr:DUF4262 domain-containing protein [Allosphingosinicella sp.]
MSLRGRSVDDPDDQYWIDLVAQYGHAVVQVADGEAEATDEPEFAYSMGAFESYGAPELIVFGLRGDIAAQIINDVLGACQAGRRFRSGVLEHGLVGGDLPLVFLDANRRLGVEYATYADWYYERQPFPLCQIFWPAKNGCFPWDADCPPEVRKLQVDLTANRYGGLSH